MRRGLKIALAIIGVAVLLGALVFVAWGLTPLGPAPGALAALESNANVTVLDGGDWIAFTPTGAAPVTGFILYPGGHVDYRSYAPVAQRIAARGYLVAIVRMPLSLAVFGVDRADPVIAAHPTIGHWAIGGHSLGGSMAASYAAKHPDTVEGIAFWASYPASGDDLSATGLKGLSVYGSNDGVLNRETLDATLPLLPNGTVIRVIEGGNHAQFGSYGPQPGDGTATISAEEQQAEAAGLTVGMLRAVGGE
jgi:dienelactone hydrolase